jgi:archaellum component FlaC
MSALADIMAGLKTVMGLTEKVEGLTKDVDAISAELRGLDRRVVRLETIVEVTRSDRAVLRIAKPESGDPAEE